MLALGSSARYPAALIQALPGRGGDVHDLRVPQALPLGQALLLGRHLQQGQVVPVGARWCQLEPGGAS